MNRCPGFTVVELTIVLGIMAILLAISSLNLSVLGPKSSLENTTQVVISNLKQQQIYAMTGQTEGRSSSSQYGLYFSADQYTLFHGNVYNANDSSNYVVTVDDMAFSTTFPGSSIIFNRISGEIANYQPGQNTITITQTNIHQSTVITLGKYGTIESIN